MALPYVSARLTAPWQEERMVLVRAPDAIRLCHEGAYQALSPHQGIAWIDRLGRREMDDVRHFVARTRLWQLSSMALDDQRLSVLLRTMLRSGELAILRELESPGGDEDDSFARQSRLVRAIEAKSRRLSYQGRQYRLVVDVRLGRLPDRDRYEVVGNQDAVHVLHGLAGEPGSEGDLSKLLAEAADMLSKDWRPPRDPDGLVLLRRTVTYQAYKPDVGPALTPSQLKKLRESDWIEVELVDQDDKPYSAHYKVYLTDERAPEGNFDQEGFLGVYEIATGTYKLAVGETKEVVEEAATVTAPTKALKLTLSETAPKVAKVAEPEVDTDEVETLKARLRLAFQDASGTPLTGVQCRLACVKAGFDLVLDAQGELDQEIPDDRGRYTVVLPDRELTVLVGQLRPVAEPSGQRQRLSNLGYALTLAQEDMASAEAAAPETASSGNAATDLDDSFRSAVEEFQCDNNVGVTGICDEATQAKLVALHGS
jgi:hypothetical protein